jgi:hypothetical protein
MNFLCRVHLISPRRLAYLTASPCLVLAFVFVFACVNLTAQQRRATNTENSTTANNATANSARQRSAPPDIVTCERNNLTVYSGRVTSYSRTRARTALTVATDWDTTERVVIRHERGRKPSAQFLYAGRRFTPADWARIESAPGKLRAGVRASVWVCADKQNTIVDWQAAAESSASSNAGRRDAARSFTLE